MTLSGLEDKYKGNHIISSPEHIIRTLKFTDDPDKVIINDYYFNYMNEKMLYSRLVCKNTSRTLYVGSPNG